jgi:tartrate-resistant acid phosphatase type 5
MTYQALLGRKRFRLLAFLSALFVLGGCDFEVVTTKGGTVSSDLGLIDCRHDGGTCLVRDYDRFDDSIGASKVQLIATPDEGYRFSHWNGCDWSERLHCYKKLSGDIEISATFEPIAYASGQPAPGALRFAAIGDFGTGDSNQELVGNAMAQVCNELGGCKFAIGLGDNMYDAVPESPYADVFDTMFEHPYRNVDFPFYMTLGNHDNSLLIDGFGNFNKAGEVQVAYTDVSDKWFMPGRYHRHDYPANAGVPVATFLALDSSPFLTMFETDPDYWVWYQWEQGWWARNELADSNATWKVAYAHHPYLSNGLHGNAGNYDGLYWLPRWAGRDWRDWLERNVCGKVDVFFTGHDHDLQVLHSIPECGNTIFVVSGAGGKTRSLHADERRNPYLAQLGDTLGFFIAEMQGNTLLLKMYTVSQADGQASLQFERSFKRRALN